MGGVIEKTFTIIVSVEFIMGSLGNGFIILVNFMDWIKRRRISSVDHILTALAVFRTGLLWSVLLSQWTFVLYPAFWMNRKLTSMILIILTVTNHFNIWLSTILSIFYFLKIANFSNSVFLYLKFRVKKVISVTLLVSVFLLVLNIIFTNVGVWIDGSKRNMSYSCSVNKFAQFSHLFSFTNTSFTFIPFAVSLTTCLLLILSLWKHLKKMQCYARGSRDASTKAHIKALQTVIASFLLCIILLLWIFVKVWSSAFRERGLTLFFVRAVGIAFPSVHSFFLILGNCKLRRASLSVLWWLRCRSKDAEPSDP